MEAEPLNNIITLDFSGLTSLLANVLKTAQSNEHEIVALRQAQETVGSVGVYLIPTLLSR